MSLFHKNQPSHLGITYSKTQTWILHSGATDHVTNYFSFYITYHFLKPLIVNPPNGIIVSAKYCGCIKNFENLWLYNILSIPEFTFNIISIPHLVSTLNCKITFYQSYCQIQDTPSLKMIGHNDLYKGLYHLKGPDNTPAASLFSINTALISVNSMKPATDVWHLRLGHPSNKVLVHVCATFPCYNK